MKAQRAQSVIRVASTGLQARIDELVDEILDPFGAELVERVAGQSTPKEIKRRNSIGSKSFSQVLERAEVIPDGSDGDIPLALYSTPRSCVRTIEQVFAKYSEKWHIWLKRPPTEHFDGIASLLSAERYAVFESQDFVGYYNSRHRGSPILGVQSDKKVVVVDLHRLRAMRAQDYSFFLDRRNKKVREQVDSYMFSVGETFRQLSDQWFIQFRKHSRTYREYLDLCLASREFLSLESEEFAALYHSIPQLRESPLPTGFLNDGYITIVNIPKLRSVEASYVQSFIDKLQEKCPERDRSAQAFFSVSF